MNRTDHLAHLTPMQKSIAASLKAGSYIVKTYDLKDYTTEIGLFSYDGEDFWPVTRKQLISLLNRGLLAKQDISKSDRLLQDKYTLRPGIDLLLEGGEE